MVEGRLSKVGWSLAFLVLTRSNNQVNDTSDVKWEWKGHSRFSLTPRRLWQFPIFVGALSICQRNDCLNVLCRSVKAICHGKRRAKQILIVVTFISLYIDLHKKVFTRTGSEFLLVGISGRGKESNFVEQTLPRVPLQPRLDWKGYL